MLISRRQLAASLLAAHHVAERCVIAAFVIDPATQPAPNPFARTSAGAVHHVWRQRGAEFRALDIEAVGLACLLRTVSGLSWDDPLVQEILRAGPHTANVFHRGDGCRIVGAVLYGKPGSGLPVIPVPRSVRATLNPRSRTRVPTGQLDLFVSTGA